MAVLGWRCLSADRTNPLSPPMSLSVNVRRNRSQAVIHPNQNREKTMSTFVRKYPAISLLGLAMLLGVSPLLAVNAGWLPPGWDQLGALSAGLAGIILAAVEGRKGGLRELLGRFLIWRVGLQWWAFALLFPILPSVAALYLFHLLGGPPVNWSGLKPLYTVIPTIIILTILAGMGEEFGWRGFALPRLQARHNALVSGLMVGVIWAFWHIPLFFTRELCNIRCAWMPVLLSLSSDIPRS